MKVFYRGFNLHNQFSGHDRIVQEFTPKVYENALQIEASHNTIVLLAADHLLIEGTNARRIKLDKICQIALNDNWILALKDDGTLYKISDSITEVPNFISDDDQIVRLSCGAKITIALTKQWRIYNIPNELDFYNDGITDIKTGREHILILDKEGNVFSFGAGSRGQLGHGVLDDEPEPKLVQALAGIKVVAVETGGWHSCAVSAQGDLYVWGWNSDGQLGLSETEATNDEQAVVLGTPQVVDCDTNIIKVACGARHTIVLLENGEVHGCGWNKYRQLKKSPSLAIFKLVYLGTFNGKLQCGPWNSLIIE